MTEVDAFLDDLDRLASAADTELPESFYGQLLPAAGAALGADAARYVGFIGPPFGGATQAGDGLAWTCGDAAVGPLVGREWLERLRLEGTPRVVPDPTGAAVIACPVAGTSATAGVLLFRLSPRSAPAERALGVATAVAESAARFEQRGEAARVTAATARLERVERLLVRLHACRTWREAAREAADAGRALVGCDRLAVVSRRGAAWRIDAVSGVSRVSRRSDAARRMERLARAAASHDGPMSVPAPVDRPLDPPLAAEIDAYRDASGARVLRVVPCTEEGDEDQRRVALLAEWFDAEVAGDADQALAGLARHVGVAARRTGGAQSTGPLSRPLVVAGLLAAAAAGAYAAVTPATLWLRVEGRFEPMDRARVFAPVDSVVAEVFVTQGERVEEGASLVRLEAPDLEVQREEVAEAIAATESEASALGTEQLRASLPGVSDDKADPTAVASRLATLRKKLARQRERQRLLDEQAARLVVTSPIAGGVVSWRPQDYLADRPVRRGQRLLEVAADGRWRVELEAPDHRSGPLLRARAAGEGERVEFVVRSDPGRTHRGVVESVAETTQPGADGEPVVRIVVAPEDALAAKPRGGLGVAAKIDCGLHPLVYVWLHEAIDAIRRRLF